MARKAESLELAVLGLLHESPLHGYELRKRLNLLLGWGRLLSYGSLYPALKRLLRAGWITEVTAASPGVSRRQRIVYQITPAGRAYFGEQITDTGPSAWEDDSFNTRFAFFSRTDADVRLRVLEGRLSRLQERLDRARHSTRGGSDGDSSDDRYLTELRRHSIEAVEREVAWLTDLINAERSPGPAVEQPDESTTTPSTGSAQNIPSAAPAADATTGSTR
ncbi:MAG: PadR family transcriptional regulator [Nocardioides sp.]